MKKNLKNRNIVTHYIRTKHFPIYEKFVETVKHDPKFLSLKYRNRKALVSVAIVQLMARYLTESGVNVKALLSKNEESDKSTSTEAGNIQ